jgi:electron transport complex protein RnfG
MAKAIARAGLGLALFALITISSVAITRALTVKRIAANREASAYRAVAEVAPAGHDGRLLEHTIILPAEPALGQPAPFTAWQAIADDNSDGDDRVLGLVVPVISTQGYNGRIDMLIGISAQGRLSGVRVTDHRETPGLGDGIEARKSDWIEQFQGLSLAAPPPGGWATNVDGGGIDALTGATITSRAVTQAVHDSLQWYRERYPENQPEQKMSPQRSASATDVSATTGEQP